MITRLSRSPNSTLQVKLQWAYFKRSATVATVTSRGGKSHHPIEMQHQENHVTRREVASLRDNPNGTAARMIHELLQNMKGEEKTAGTQNDRLHSK